MSSSYLLAAAQATHCRIAFDLFATGYGVLVGPIFIPFFHRPKFGMALLGLVKCFIQYAFYQVIAAAVVYVIANLILGILIFSQKGLSRRSSSLRRSRVLFINFLASIYALSENTALTNHIFSGTAGGSSVGIPGEGSYG